MLTSNAGLLLIAPHLRNPDYRNALTRASRIKKNSRFISDVDIVSYWIALLALGKSEYDAIEEYSGDKDFKRLLGIRTVPSAVTHRQRIEDLPGEIADVLREFNMRIIATAFERAKQHRKNDQRFQESLTIGNNSYVVIDSDVSILDNSDSKKESVEWTYKKCDRNAPMFSCIGASGYMLNSVYIERGIANRGLRVGAGRKLEAVAVAGVRGSSRVGAHGKPVPYLRLVLNGREILVDSGIIIFRYPCLYK